MTLWDKLTLKVPKGTTEVPEGLRIRKLADYSEGQHTRIHRWNPETGVKYVADAKTGEPKPWPLLGVVLEHAPQSTIIPTTTVNRGRNEKWITLEGAEVKFEPGGPPEDPWRVTHTFEQGKFVVFHTVDGDIRYKIIHNPGKYIDEDEPGRMRVDWFYLCEKVS
jgi:hypothetical protein